LEDLVKVGECLCGTIAQFEQEIIIREGASDDSRFVKGALQQKGVEFYAGLPLKAKGKTTGVLCVFNFTHFKPDEDLIDTLRAATVPIGLAIENARLYIEMREMEYSLHQADKMVSLGTLASSVAHEIRNPITTIRVFSEYVNDRLSEDEFRGKYRNVVTKEVDKIDRIIQTLIDFSGK